jgi:predicted alpha/beta-fold hydrolase
MSDLKPSYPHPRLEFQPHLLIRHRHLQTILPTLLAGPAPALEQAAAAMILDAGEGIRLEGRYSAPPDGHQARGLVLLLHGWLGSVHSNYILSLGEYLYQHGYAIFRLNLRDHGETHHLNPGPFRSDRLDEVFLAMQQIARLAGSLPLHLLGVSLGGNFALRLAWRHSQTPVASLGRTIAVCPVIDPHHTTLMLDGSPYLLYFRRKWRRAMQKKQAAFPQLNFAGAIAARSCMDMTEAFVAGHSPYPDARAYFERYTITPAMLGRLKTPVTILAAADDPIIPAADFTPLANLNSRLHLSLQPFGGHVGFVDLFPWQNWLCPAALSILET